MTAASNSELHKFSAAGHRAEDQPLEQRFRLEDGGAIEDKQGSISNLEEPAMLRGIIAATPNSIGSPIYSLVAAVNNKIVEGEGIDRRLRLLPDDVGK